MNEPVWDYRLPQIRFGQLKNITKVMDCNLNLHRWPRMLGSAGSQLGVDGESPKMVAALLQLDATGRYCRLLLSLSRAPFLFMTHYR